MAGSGRNQNHRSGMATGENLPKRKPHLPWRRPHLSPLTFPNVNQTIYTSLPNTSKTSLCPNTNSINPSQNTKHIDQGRHDEWTVVKRKQRKQKADHGPEKKNEFFRRHSNPVVQAKLDTLSSLNKCYRCHASGHKRSSCRNALRCFYCSDYGHSFLRCPRFHINGDSLLPTANSTVVNGDSSLPTVNSTVVPSREQRKNIEINPHAKTVHSQSTGHESRNFNYGYKYSYVQALTANIPQSNSTKNNSLPQTLRSLPSPLLMAVPWDWRNLPLPNNDNLVAVRPHHVRVYLPNRDRLRQSNQLLHRTAFVIVGDHENHQNLPERISSYLSRYFRVPQHRFTVGFVDNNFGDLIVVCPDIVTRERLCSSNPHFIDSKTQVQFDEWSLGYSMSYNPTTHRAMIKLSGVPLHDWNQIEIRTLVSGFGYPLRTVLYFVNGNFQYLRVLIACHKPEEIPCILDLTDEPFGTMVEVELEGWTVVEGGPFPPDGGDDDGADNNDSPQGHLVNLTRGVAPSESTIRQRDVDLSDDSTDSDRRNPATRRGHRSQAIQKNLHRWVWQPKRPVCHSSVLTSVQCVSNDHATEDLQNSKLMSLHFKDSTGISINATKDLQNSELMSLFFKDSTGISIFQLVAKGAMAFMKASFRLQTMVIPKPFAFTTGLKVLPCQNLSANLDINFESASQDFVPHTQLTLDTSSSVFNESVALTQKDFGCDVQVMNDNPDGSPPGFSGPPRYALPHIQPNRRSARLQAKNKGPYLSVIQKAQKVSIKNFGMQPVKSRNKRKLHKKVEEERAYLNQNTPLTEAQGEMILFAAGIEIKEGEMGKELQGHELVIQGQLSTGSYEDVLGFE